MSSTNVFGATLPSFTFFTLPAMASLLNEFKFGSAAIASISALSCLMVVFLIVQLLVITVARRCRKTDARFVLERVFLKTHLGLYVFCLLITNFASGLAGVIQAVWAIRTDMGQDLEAFNTPIILWEFGSCEAQAWLFQIGDVGSAIWTFVMALHVFRTLVCHKYLTFRGVAIVLAIGWILTWFIALLGPLALQKQGVSFYGPIFSSDGGPLWCWIFYPYSQFRFWFHYLIMLVSALFSAVLYIMVYVIMRARNRPADTTSMVSESDCTFRPRYEAWLWVAVKRMLALPLAYVILIFPITLCRLFDLSGYQVPYWAFLVSACIFSMTGFVNGAILIWASKVLQTKQWKMLLEYWGGRANKDVDLESTPRTGSLEKTFEESSSSSGVAANITDTQRSGERPRLTPLITAAAEQPGTSRKSRLTRALARRGTAVSSRSPESRRTISTFFSETPADEPTLSPHIARKPVPPILPRRSSLRGKFKRFSNSVTDRIKAIEGSSPVEEPRTSILDRFPLPPILQRLSEAEHTPELPPKRHSKSAPTTPRAGASHAPGGTFRSLPSHPGAFRKASTAVFTAAPPRKIDRPPTPGNILNAHDGENGNDDEDQGSSDESDDSLTPLSAKPRSTYSSTRTITERAYRRSRTSLGSRFTYGTLGAVTVPATASATLSPAGTSTRGLAL